MGGGKGSKKMCNKLAFQAREEGPSPFLSMKGEDDD